MTAAAFIAPPPLADDDGFCVRSLAATYPHGSGEPPHRHHWGQLVYGVSGVIRVALDRAAWIAPPTRAIWVPPGVTHALSMKGQVAMRTLYIAPGWASALPREAAVLEVEPLLREVILHVLKIGMLAPDQPAHERLAGFLVDRLAAGARGGGVAAHPAAAVSGRDRPVAGSLAPEGEADPRHGHHLGGRGRDRGGA